MKNLKKGAYQARGWPRMLKDSQKNPPQKNPKR